MKATSWTPSWLLVAWERWRWLARRWTFALIGFAVGWLWVAWLHAPSLAVLSAQEEQLQSLQGQLAQLKLQTRQAQLQGQKAAQQASLQGLAQWPNLERQGVIWLQFSQLLAQHAVELRSLRPVPDALPAPLPSQAVAVRLHGQFDDWVAVWRAMNANGPVWSIDRLRITPQAPGVDIEAVLRVWWGDGPGPDDMAQADRATAGLIPLASVRSAVFWQQPGQVFDAPVKSRAMQAAAPPAQEVTAHAAKPTEPAKAQRAQSLDSTAALSADPAQWPVERVRLLGVWHQAQEAHAILAAGPHWVRARVGQQVGDHRLGSIHAQEVHLLAAQGSVKVLGLAKAAP
jgi:hypothetical protein